MRRKFLTWLLLLVCATFVVTGLLAYLQFDKQAQGRAQHILFTRLNDLSELINQTNDNMQHVVEINEESALVRTRAIAKIIQLNPSILNNYEELQELCNDIEADQLCVTDDNGVVIAAVPNELVGFDLKNHDQSRIFIKCINLPGEEIVQRAQKNAYNGEILQYTGVSRKDKKGVIQLGFAILHEQAVRKNTAFTALADTFKLGKNGHIIAFNGGAQISGSDQNFVSTDLLSLPLNEVATTTHAGQEYYTYVLQKGDIRIIGLLPVSEINDISLSSIKQLFISNIFLFLVMFLLVWVLLQKLVLKGLGRINHSLHRISEGYKDERVDVRDTPEFTRLSTGINTMVDSLQAYAEHRRDRLRKELTLARSVQETILPHTFPAFPEQTTFDLHAARIESENVGGDFYDYFMADKEHLCFMLGDVSTPGIPGAMFMMRALSIIRALASAGLSPEEVMKEANLALCENNVTKTRLSLFLARLNIKSGVLRFINAGTPQALRATDGKEFEMLPMRSGAVLGAYAKSIYKECIIKLAAGDRMLLYSQGVLKATNAAKQTFGAAGLQQSLRTRANNVTDLTRNLQVAIKNFTGSKEQSEDCTMLALEFKGKWQQSQELHLSADSADKETKATEFTEQLLESVLASPNAIQEILLAVNDIISSLPPNTEISYKLNCNEAEAEVSIRYSSNYNPFAHLPQLPVNHSDYHYNEQNGTTLTLYKSLA